MSDREHRRQAYFSDLTRATPMQSPEPLLKELDASTACFCISTCDICPSKNTWRFVVVCEGLSWKQKVETDWEEERACSTCRRTSSLALSGFLSYDLIFPCLIRTRPFVLTSMNARDGFLSI